MLDFIRSLPAEILDRPDAIAALAVVGVLSAATAIISERRSR